MKKKYVLLIVVCLVVFGVWYLNRDTSFDEKAKKGTSNNLQDEAIEKMLEESKESNKFVVSMNTDMKLENGKSEGAFNIENAPDNGYIMMVEIYVTKTKELVYKTGKIKPGEIIREDTLDVALPKGEYECTVLFKALNQKDGQQVTTTSIGTKIQIEKDIK